MSFSNLLTQSMCYALLLGISRRGKGSTAKVGPGTDRASYCARLGLELMRDPVGRLEWGDPTEWFWWDH
jgi:hypothetical protein